MKNKERLLQKNKIYYQGHKDEFNEWRRRKRQSDEAYRLHANMSCTIYSALKSKKQFRKWTELVKYTLKDLMTHLESKFTKGMTWENYGKNGWNVDHIIPQSLFQIDSTDHPAFHACWALENLQPLWSTTKIAISYGEGNDYLGNFEKGDKIKLTKKQEKLLKSVNLR